MFQKSFHDWAVHRLVSKYGGVEQGWTLCPLLRMSSASSEICIWFTEKKRQEFGQIRHRGLNSRQKLPGKIDFFPHCAAVINPNSDTLADWGKLLILHALDAVYTPPSFCHTGKFSVPRRLRQKMRLLYLNDYGNGEHAAGPL